MRSAEMRFGFHSTDFGRRAARAAARSRCQTPEKVRANMNKEMREHVAELGRHGVCVLTAAGKRKLSGGFYDEIVRFCEQYGINCIGYDIEVPGAEADHMMLAIWRNGHVDSGSADHIHAVMDQ